MTTSKTKALRLTEFIQQHQAKIIEEWVEFAATLLPWAKGMDEKEAHADKQNDVTRFNEAIDESLTEATVRYSEILDHTREQFLGILGHDLRNPLAAIVMGATLLTKSEKIDDKEARVASRILNSAGRMSRMVSDLLDLTRTRLGTGIPIARKRMDLTPMCRQVISELEAIHPGGGLRFESTGELLGDWDSDRLTQVVSNLVGNALQHGGEDGVVRVVAEEHGDEVVMRVHNEGPIIPENALKTIFDPMDRQPTHGGDRNTSGLGLGLYIAREIVTAHGGTITVTSNTTEGTTFTMQLPRRASGKTRPIPVAAGEEEPRAEA